METSIIIVSFNTKELLRKCIIEAINAAENLNYEIIVVDNNSKDGSGDMVKKEFPEIVFIQSGANIGFGAANNLGFKKAGGKYIVLLNSDAFIIGDSLKISLDKIKSDSRIGLVGGKLRGEKNEWQPSARTFPSIINDLFILSGLSDKYKTSKLFGKPDMTYKNQEEEFECDWVPGAFSIIRREAIEGNIFDERYFLYSEEVDMCLQLKRRGWKILYCPEIEVIHLGGASTSFFSDKLVSKLGMQMTLWRLQSQYLYYRKNFGFFKSLSSKYLEQIWNYLRYKKNIKKNPKKAKESKIILELIKKAWKNTNSGIFSPEKPWKGE